MESDVLLTENIRNGNLEALGELYKKYYHSLLYFAKSLTNNPQLADDLVQDCFLKFWDHRLKLPLNLHAKAYLFSILYNLWLNHQKHLKVVNQYSEEAGKDLLVNQTTSENDTNHKTRLIQALKAVPERCRLIFILHHLKNMSHKEIASSLDISPKTVEVQIRKAKIILQAELKSFKKT